MGRRRWTEQDLRDAVGCSTSIRQVLRRLGLVEAGGNYAQVKKYIEQYGICTDHLRGQAWNKGLRGAGRPRKALDEILVCGSTFQSFKLKKRLFEAGIKRPACEECGWAQRANDGRVPLELDHVNGDARDNRLENLRILCPNCHSLKPTHRGRNRRKQR